MLGARVCSDFALNTISDEIPCQTPWGKQFFQKGLLNCSTNSATIKRKQLPLLALLSEPKTVDKVHNELKSLTDITTHIDDSINNKIGLKIVELFNNYLNEKREEFNSLFLSNYRESTNNNIARKRISFTLVYEICNYLINTNYDYIYQ
jgi:hypothetical protein